MKKIKKSFEKVLTLIKTCRIICLALLRNKKIKTTGCGSAWLERLIWDQEVAGSNPVTPTYLCGCSSMVEH